MARDGYRSSREPSPSRSPRELSPLRESSKPRHSSQRSSVYLNEIDNRLPARSRAGSTARVNNMNTDPPLHDAIQSAVRTADTAGQVDPDLIAQITEQVTQNVINKFKTDGIPSDMSHSGSSTPAQPHQPIPTRGDPRRESPSPPFISRQYTPPSPGGRYDWSNQSYRSSSPDPAPSEASSHASADMTRTARRRESAHSPPRNEETRERPKPARVATAIHEATTLEKIWGPLFDNGRPTARLGQFLRGIAIHLIEDYEPKSSLVVTPGKMVKFFKEVKQPDEIYPFQDIFGGKCTNVSISRMYRGLACQHHLTQFNHSDEPTIPGLTPHGFEVWMTNLILAHPDKEFERLARAVLHMPISNADSRSERFPKELPRRLLPREDDRAVQQKLWTVISADRSIQLRSSNPVPPPPSQPPPQAQPPPPSTSFGERERNPYSGTTSGSFSGTSPVKDDEETTPRPRVPIERERQPYTARQGTGKIYDDREREPSSATSGATRSSRSNSATPASASSYSSSTARPMDVPPTSQRQHRSSMTGVKPGYAFQNSPPSDAGSSGTRNPFVRSEGANLNEIPPSFYASNIPSATSFDDEKRGYSGRRLDNDTGFSGSGHRNSVPPPARTNSTASGYEYLNGRESRDTRDPYDDRRRPPTYPNSGQSGAGTDGYGSYSGGAGGSRY